MFRGTQQIQLVVDHLARRDASLWHACQLADLRSYLKVRGIPSRSLLEQARLPFTGFVTDSTDRSRGVWSCVFVNLADFGAIFAHGYSAVPNPYGPIVMQIHPRTLARAADVAVTLRSAGAHDFDRHAEGLDSLEQLERLFRYPATAGFPERIQVLYGDRLRSRFSPGYPDAATAEMSLTMDPELIPLEDVVAVWVDPMASTRLTLLDAVASEFRQSGIALRVLSRWMAADRVVVLADIARYVMEGIGPVNLRGLVGQMDIHAATREWALALLGRDLDWQFQRYARYLREGTLAADAQFELPVVARMFDLTRTTQDP